MDVRSFVIIFSFAIMGLVIVMQAIQIARLINKYENLTRRFEDAKYGKLELDFLSMTKKIDFINEFGTVKEEYIRNAFLNSGAEAASSHAPRRGRGERPKVNRPL